MTDRTPEERPDAHCADCPYADRGDWVMYRDEYEALLRDRQAAIVERERLWEALREISHVEFRSTEDMQQFARDALAPDEDQAKENADG